MNFILNIVEPYLTDKLQKNTSLACISTSNPVYLVFEPKQIAPCLIVRSAGSTDVVMAHEVTEKLHKYIPNLIPEPIAIVKTELGEFAIQRGVTGLPWFQVANEFKTIDDWKNLRAKTLNSLEQLHTAIQQQGERQELNVYTYAQQCLIDAVSAGLKLNKAQLKGIQNELNCLNSLPELPVYPHHGDFCINNLIIEQDQIHIIDFEDYGMSCLPLFDHFSLALSLYSSAPIGLGLSLEEEISLCSSYLVNEYKISQEQLNALFIVHLLIRLGTWSSGDRRKVFRKFLEDKLKEWV